MTPPAAASPVAAPIEARQDADPRQELARLRRELAESRENELRLRQQLRTQHLESIGRVADGGAQDLKSILTPMLMSIALLDELTEAAESRRLLNVISDSAQRGAGMLRQMLAFARGVDKPQQLVEPRQLIEDLRRLMAETFPQSIELVVEVAPEMPAINADATELHQALVNLCINAREAMTGGGRLVLRADVVDVDTAYAAMTGGARPGRYVVFNVSDSGRGMTADVRAQVFRPFLITTANGRRTKRGIPAVQTIVRAHGGFLTVHSEAGRGTTIQVFIPAVDSADTGVLATSTLLPCGSDELVLVVDSEALVRSTIKELLTAHGYRVVTAANGADAVAEFARQKDDVALVLTDMTLPVMDGAGTIRALRTIDPSVKLIAATGRERVDSEGISGLIKKPYRADSLLHLIRQVLDR